MGSYKEVIGGDLEVSEKLAGKKGGPIPEHLRLQIKEELTNLIISGQTIGIPDTKLAEKFGITVKTLKNLLHELYSEISKENVNEMSVKFNALFDRMFVRANKVLNQNVDEAGQILDKKLETAVWNSVMNLIEKKTAIMESFGIKPKVAEQIEIKQEGVLTVDIMQQIYEKRLLEVKDDSSSKSKSDN